MSAAQPFHFAKSGNRCDPLAPPPVRVTEAHDAALVRAFEAGRAEASRRVAVQRSPVIEAEIADVTAQTGVTRADILGACRLRHIVAARHMLMRRLRDLGYSLPEIGRATDRDHTTVMNALRKWQR